jgi:hypothetical protein
VKKITKIFEKEIFAKRALREIKLLKHFSGHENVRNLLHSLCRLPELLIWIFSLWTLTKCIEIPLTQISCPGADGNGSAPDY